MELADKHAIVTGDASGIGTATAAELTRLGPALWSRTRTVLARGKSLPS